MNRRSPSSRVTTRVELLEAPGLGGMSCSSTAVVGPSPGAELGEAPCADPGPTWTAWAATRRRFVHARHPQYGLCARSPWPLSRLALERARVALSSSIVVSLSCITASSITPASGPASGPARRPAFSSSVLRPARLWSERPPVAVNASTRASALTPPTGSLLSVSYAFAYQPLLPSRIGKEHRIFSPSSNRPYAGSYGVIRNKVGLLI